MTSIARQQVGGVAGVVEREDGRRGKPTSAVLLVRCWGIRLGVSLVTSSLVWVRAAVGAIVLQTIKSASLVLL